jgi:hypothetical protein
VETGAPPRLPIAPLPPIGSGFRLGAVERIHPPQPRLHNPVVYCVEYAPEALRHSHHAASRAKPPRNAASHSQPVPSAKFPRKQPKQLGVGLRQKHG